MRVSTFAPSAALAPFVRCFTVIETDEAATRTLLPDSGIVLGLRWAGFAIQTDAVPTRPLPNASLAGMRASVRRMHTSAAAGIVLATFVPGGAAAFFDEPLHELFERTLPLDELIRASELERAASEVAAGHDHTERVAALDRLLASRLRRGARDRVVGAAVGAIVSEAGALRIGELARRLELSRDRLEKRFRHAVGATPKQLATLLRVRRAVDLHRAGQSLTDAALGAGYFDQSHFVREFRRITGQAPRRFFRGVEHC